MSRSKHTKTSFIDPSEPVHEQCAAAHMGSLRDYMEIFDALSEVVFADKTKDFQIRGSGDSSVVADAKQSILQFVVSSIVKGEPEKIRTLADVLEYYLKGVAVRPLEACLIQLKIDRQEWEKRKLLGETDSDEDAFWDEWPFPPSRLKEHFMKSQGRAFNENGRPLSDVKKAAELVELPYRTVSKGRPRGSKNKHSD